MSNKEYFGSIFFNDTKTRINLGKSTLPKLLERLVAQSRNFPDSLEQGTMHFAATKEALTTLEQSKLNDSKPELSWSEQWALDNPDLITPIEEVESPIPGVSLEYWLERRNSPIYDTWNLFCCFPDKRIGVPQSVIDEARDSWFKHAPEIAPHFPKWVT